jgi:hypothetical protein
VMNLAVIDPAVFVAGVFWRHEPHQCLKAWLRGMMTPVMTEDILAEYEAGLEWVKQEQQFATDTGPLISFRQLTAHAATDSVHLAFRAPARRARGNGYTSVPLPLRSAAPNADVHKDSVAAMASNSEKMSA